MTTTLRRRRLHRRYLRLDRCHRPAGPGSGLIPQPPDNAGGSVPARWLGGRRGSGHGRQANVLLVNPALPVKTFARVLGHYSRELGLFSLEAAVRKMTGATAMAFGLQGRGELRVGHAPDITLFDAGKVIDRATYLTPTEQALGIEHVIVNGTAVWASGVPTGARPGQCLRRSDS